MNRREFTQAIAAAGAGLAAGREVGAAGERHTPIPNRKRIENTPVMLEVAINGSTTKTINRHAPETTSELAAEAIRCFDAGATIVHIHSGKPNSDVKVAAQYYIDAFKPVRKKHPYGILYPTANFDPAVYHKNRTVWPAKIQSGHYRAIAEAGLANMVLLDTGVVPLAVYDERGLPGPPEAFWWYGFWPEDVRMVVDLCAELGTGASISVFEPGWMKNVVAMARAGTLPRGSKLNIYFADYNFAGMAPPISEALQMYLHMIEGMDIKWSVGMVGASIMETPLARMALERGGSFRVGLEDWGGGPSNVEQMEMAKELINKVGRPIASGPDALDFLDISFPATRS